MKKREKIRSIVRAFEVIHKLQKDVLTQYDSEVELYENKEGFPILGFQFYSESIDDKNDRDDKPF